MPSIPRVLACVSALLALAPVARADDVVGCGMPPGSERCEIWAARYSGTVDGADAALAIDRSPDGRTVYVTGRSAAATYDFATVALDASTGVQRWAARYDGPSHAYDEAVGVEVTADGSRVIVAGTSEGDFAIVGYDAGTGAQLWVARYAGPVGGETATAVRLSSDGSYAYVTGWSEAAGGPTGVHLDAATVAIDTSSGTRLWVRRYDGPAGFWDVPYALAAGAVPQSGGGAREMVFVSSRTNVGGTGNNQTDMVTVALDGAAGDVLWQDAYDGPAHDRDYPYAAALSPDGTRLYVTGESWGIGSDYATLGYDAATGARAWASRWNHVSDDRPLGIAVSPDGSRIAVTGSSGGPNGNVDRGAGTVLYDRDGAQRWAARHTYPAGETGVGVAFAPDGARVYVAGLTVGHTFVVGTPAITPSAGFAGFLAIAYDVSAGTQTWEAHFSDPGGARDLVISPDGTALTLAGGSNDMVTVAYPTGPADAPCELPPAAC